MWDSYTLEQGRFANRYASGIPSPAETESFRQNEYRAVSWYVRE